MNRPAPGTASAEKRLFPLRHHHTEREGGSHHFRSSGTDARSRAGSRRSADAPEPGKQRAAGHDPRSAKRAPADALTRFRCAVTERLPLWVQSRCAVEPRTLAALAVVLVVAVGFAGQHFLGGRPEAVPAPQPASFGFPTGEKSPRAATPGRKQLVVDVAGDVREPGVHRLPDGSRVEDALKAAGGLRPGMGREDLGGLNQARRLVDGEQIVVGAAAGPSAAPTAGSAAQGAPQVAARVSLSSATAEELESLPGVGPVLAQHIIDYRTQHGGFTSVEQLREVNGIGDARYADLETRVGP